MRNAIQFLLLSFAALAVSVPVALAQTADNTKRVGYVVYGASGPRGHLEQAFLDGMREQGYLQRELPAPLRVVQCLKFLETPDGAWANARGLHIGSTNATAAAVTLLHQIGVPVNATVGDWLLAQAHPDGGFRAMPAAPLPDLLSTATTLHALACLEREVPKAIRERCLDFIDTLWSAEGGFHGHWADDHLDAEYTFYGLLALGHLSV